MTKILTDRQRVAIAQFELLTAMKEAFKTARKENVSQDLFDELDMQFARVEKLFGYKPSTFSRE